MITTYALSKRFRHTAVVDNVDLQVPVGAIYALIGPNGAGKTTLLKLILGLMPPTSGSVSLGGVELAQIGFVSEGMQLPENMTIVEFLAYLAPFYATWDRALAESLLAGLQLPVDRRLRHLSRGMKMKVQLVASLAYRPKLLIMDEPFSGLDSLVRDEVIQTMLEMADQMTVFISSHDLAEMESFATHVGYLDSGRLRFSEELPGLQGRFREVEVTLAEPAGLAGLPTTAIAAAAMGPVLRYIEGAFDPERTYATLRERYPNARQIDINPLPLRSIFVALAREGRRS